MKGKNEKVPVAVLSCFLIAFVLQGILKICGVFVFEKALDWGVFKIIDNTLWLQIIYYSVLVFITMWCLSFALTDRFYSKKWYHYVIMAAFAVGNTVLKLLVPLTFGLHILCDVILYILIPFVISLTTNNEHRLLKRDLFGIVVTLSIHIALYFAYLGLNYWSNLLTSLVPTIPVVLPASTNFLIQLEVYIGLIATMLSLNMFIKKLKGDNTMNIPINIASKKAKLEAKKIKLEKELAKINADLEHLNSEDNK